MVMIKVPKMPTIRRMPMYLHKLLEIQSSGTPFVSTTTLAQYMNLEPIVVRKDLETTGVMGQPGVGYKTDEVVEAIRVFLGWDKIFNACLVGAGSLGSALLGYEGFESNGLLIETVFDADPAKIGRKIHGREVHCVSGMRTILEGKECSIGIICVPNNHAQSVADVITACGVKAIWNFTNVSLQVPDDVVVQREVIAGGFALLSVQIAQTRAERKEVTDGH